MRRTPQCREGQFFLGEVAREEAQWASAARHYERALIEAPGWIAYLDSFAALQNLGMVDACRGEWAKAQAAFEEIIDAALELGGTVTGEHGVGLLKMGGLAKELDPVVLAMHRSVKAALDPHGILNCGKVFA